MHATSRFNACSACLLVVLYIPSPLTWNDCRCFEQWQTFWGGGLDTRLAYVRTRLTQSNLSMRMQMCVHGVCFADHALCMVLAYLYVRGLVYTQPSYLKRLPLFQTVTDILGRWAGYLTMYVLGLHNLIYQCGCKCVSMAYFLQIMHCVWCLLTYTYVVLYIPSPLPQNVCHRSEQWQTFWGGELGTRQAYVVAKDRWAK